MRRIALVSLTLTLGGCGYHTWWNPPFTSGFNPNVPVTNSVNMGRVMGEGVAVTPLKTQPGDIWPGPLPPPKTLQDMERQSSTSGAQAPGAAGRGSALGRSGTLAAPLPSGTLPGQVNEAPSTQGQPQADRRIIVPNGNGTSTVIYPDGRIETIPTPK